MRGTRFLRTYRVESVARGDDPVVRLSGLEGGDPTQQYYGLVTVDNPSFGLIITPAEATHFVINPAVGDELEIMIDWTDPNVMVIESIVSFSYHDID